jgi:glucans biosynthesis protein C
MAYLYNCSTWMLSFALIGVFLRYFPKQTPVLKYLAESSYWSYLVHMLGTIGFGVLLYQAPLGVLAKMTINMTATTLFCLATYHWFVRERKVGRLLNGKSSNA